MKKIIIIVATLLTIAGCTTTKQDDEWNIIPEYIDYNISETNLVVLYNAFNAQPLNNITYAEYR